ncbi:ATPase, partial [Candidatus Geothermarchaeota archaeon]
DRPITKEEIEEMIKEIKDYAEEGESFIEIDKREILIVQLRNYRIVATRPPLSDGLELTAVRPVVKLSLLDYNLPPELIKRLSEGAEGILIAGAPGEGKTTFAQALAEFYRDKGKVVKTIEAPRDLQLPDDITQYSKTIANAREMHDILLLSRPDYTIFDEMRNDEDFKLYMDLRLAGVGMVGVVHATTPIDAIQRFVERIDLGMIPSILDTVIFIKNGAVKKVYEVKLVAKVPHGLKREDLARPIVEVRDFFTKRKEYEMYIFGKRIFVIPLKKGRDLDFQNLVEGIIRGELGEYAAWVKVEFISDKEATVYVPEDRFNVIKRRIKRKLRRIERKFGISLFLKPMEETSGYSPFNLIE